MFRPRIVNGSSRIARTCSTILTASCCPQPGSSTANSSPPSRASVSVAAQRVEHARADLLEQEVAGLMAERVVELLEAVEIGDEQRQRQAVLLGERELLAQTLVEVAAVRQPGQLVGRRLAAGLRERADLAEAQGQPQQRGDDGRAGEGQRRRVDVREVAVDEDAHRRERQHERQRDGDDGPACPDGASSRAAAAARRRAR